MAKRIQRKRTKGWKMPENAVYVGRPTVFGNPFSVEAAIEAGCADTDKEARSFVVDCYRDWLLKGDLSEWWFNDGNFDAWVELRRKLPELRGKDLACFCPLDQPCHADVLIELLISGANK